MGLPTETVYGLAADADNDAAVAAIFAMKGRPSNHPLIVHVAHLNPAANPTAKPIDNFADPTASTASNPAVAHFASRLPSFAGALMAAYWPGPLTLILPRRAGVATAAAGGQDSIGLRCPAHPVAQALLHDCLRRPVPVWGLAAPSANRFGRVSPTTAAHVQSELGASLAVLDGGPCAIGIESTIIDCTRGAPVLLRPGHITPEQVLARLGLQVLTEDEFAAHDGHFSSGRRSVKASDTKTEGSGVKGAARGAETGAGKVVGKGFAAAVAGLAQKAMLPSMLRTAIQAKPAATHRAAPRASGTLEAHYAPNAKLRLMDARALQTALDMLGSDIDAAPPTIAVYSRLILRSRSSTVIRRRMPDDAVAVAQQLFAVLREFDAHNVKLIWVETPPPLPEWAGVHDRLTRAAAS